MYLIAKNYSAIILHAIQNFSKLFTVELLYYVKTK